MAHSHIRRTKLLPGEISRQYCADFLRAWGVGGMDSGFGRHQAGARPAVLHPKIHRVQRRCHRDRMKLAKLAAGDEWIELGFEAGR
jgi:hypothetical protein